VTRGVWDASLSYYTKPQLQSWTCGLDRDSTYMYTIQELTQTLTTSDESFSEP